MSIPIVSSIVGTLVKNNEFWSCSPIRIPFWENIEAPIYFDFNPHSNPGFMDEADIVLKNFFQLDNNVRLAASSEVFDYCSYSLKNNMPDYFDEVEYALSKSLIASYANNPEHTEEVWKLVYGEPTFMIQQDIDDEMYVVISIDCHWSTEGLQLALRQGLNVTRVSSQDGNLF